MTDTSHVHLPILDQAAEVDPPTQQGIGLRVFAVGLGLIVVIFGGYELVERYFLGDASPELLHRLHILRGIGSAFVVAGWAYYATVTTQRHAEAELKRRIAALDAEVSLRNRELVQSQAFTEALFDSLRERVIVTDASGRVVKSNRTAREAANCDLDGRICTEVFTECAEDCQAHQAHERASPSLTPIVRRDPRSGRVWSIEAYPMHHGTRGLVLEVSRDVTDARRLEALVRHQEKMASLGVLAAGIAHDIGNPLACISSELEMLEGETDPQRIEESLNVLRGHVSRIVRTLREMVAFARRREEVTEAVNVADAVRDALRLVRHDKRTRNVEFVENLADGLPSVHMVEDHLVLVIVNLVLNALDAMLDCEAGTIEVSATASDDGVSVVVTDTGCGMSEEVLGKATEPLFTTKAEGEGTGLGLMVSQSTIQAAGGKLAIESHPGRGTKVIVTLPTTRHEPRESDG